MTLRIGTSGWSYDHWQGVLYEPGLPTAKRLAAYAAEFDTVELNASFYRWPRDTTFTGWRTRLPPGFELAVKAPRGLTHGRRLYSPEPWPERIRNAMHALGDRRGPLLVQLPPDLERDDARLDYFLGTLPDWMRVVVEPRHPSWFDEGVYTLLEWADRIREWQGQGLDVSAYFNNDGDGHAVRNARTLSRLLA